MNIIHTTFENVENIIFREKRVTYQIMKMLRTKGLDTLCNIQLVARVKIDSQNTTSKNGAPLRT
jgi:hypothetical protein